MPFGTGFELYAKGAQHPRPSGRRTMLAAADGLRQLLACRYISRLS
jgi:hypothetical protein